MPYGGDPQYEQADEVRLLMGDTATSSPYLSDDEVDYLIATYTTSIKAAYHGVLLIMSKLSAKGRIAVGTAEKNFGDDVERFQQIANSLKERGGAVGDDAWKVAAPQAGGLRTDDNPLFAEHEWDVKSDDAGAPTP